MRMCPDGRTCRQRAIANRVPSRSHQRWDRLTARLVLLGWYKPSLYMELSPRAGQCSVRMCTDGRTCRQRAIPNPVPSRALQRWNRLTARLVLLGSYKPSLYKPCTCSLVPEQADAVGGCDLTAAHAASGGSQSRSQAGPISVGIASPRDWCLWVGTNRACTNHVYGA